MLPRFLFLWTTWQEGPDKSTLLRWYVLLTFAVRKGLRKGSRFLHVRCSLCIPSHFHLRGGIPCRSGLRVARRFHIKKGAAIASSVFEEMFLQDFPGATFHENINLIGQCLGFLHPGALPVNHKIRCALHLHYTGTFLLGA